MKDKSFLLSDYQLMLHSGYIYITMGKTITVTLVTVGTNNGTVPKEGKDYRIEATPLI
jgi:hypothetical protein